MITGCPLNFANFKNILVCSNLKIVIFLESVSFNDESIIIDVRFPPFRYVLISVPKWLRVY